MSRPPRGSCRGALGRISLGIEVRARDSPSRSPSNPLPRRPATSPPSSPQSDLDGRNGTPQGFPRISRRAVVDRRAVLRRPHARPPLDLPRVFSAAAAEPPDPPRPPSATTSSSPTRASRAFANSPRRIAAPRMRMRLRRRNHPPKKRNPPRFPCSASPSTAADAAVFSTPSPSTRTPGSAPRMWCSSGRRESRRDDISLEYVRGATVDYVEEMIKSSFAIVENPNAQSGCGCGTSFASSDRRGSFAFIIHSFVPSGLRLVQSRRNPTRSTLRRAFRRRRSPARLFCPRSPPAPGFLGSHNSHILSSSPTGPSSNPHGTSSASRSSTQSIPVPQLAHVWKQRSSPRERTSRRRLLLLVLETSRHSPVFYPRPSCAPSRTVPRGGECLHGCEKQQRNSLTSRGCSVFSTTTSGVLNQSLRVHRSFGFFPKQRPAFCARVRDTVCAIAFFIQHHSLVPPPVRARGTSLQSSSPSQRRHGHQKEQ